MWKNMSKDAQCVKQTKLTPTIRNHTYTPLPQTQKHSHSKSLPWTSSQSYHHHKDTTQYSPLLTTTVPRQPCLSPATKQSPARELQSCTSNTYTLTMVYPRNSSQTEGCSSYRSS